MKHYVLKNKVVKEAKSLEEWGQFIESKDRIVKKTTMGNVMVSTVFIGTDKHELFETMIFGGKRDQQYQERHNTWKQAEEGHEIAVALVKEDNK